MPYLVAAVVLVGLLCAVDLLLTLAVVRRLREHEQRFAEHGGAAPAPYEPPIDRVPEFTASTVDGRTIGGADLGGSLVAFFSTNCVACDPEVPKFLAYVADESYQRDSVLAVVTGVDTPKGQRLVEQLRQAVEVVREPYGGTVSTAFATHRFPAYYVVAEGGDIGVGAPSVAGLPRRVRA